MSTFRVGQTVRIHCANHPRNMYSGRIAAIIEHDGIAHTCKLDTAAGPMLVSAQYLQPDAVNREMDRVTSWRNCGWQPKEYR